VYVQASISDILLFAHVGSQVPKSALTIGSNHVKFKFVR
jgi:hypothetical protein